MVRCSEDRILENAKPEYERAVAAGAAHARGAVYRDQRRGGWWDLLAARAGGTVGGCCGGVGLPGSRLRGRTNRTLVCRGQYHVRPDRRPTCLRRRGDGQDGRLHGRVDGVAPEPEQDRRSRRREAVRSANTLSRKLRTHEDCSTPYPELSIPRPLSSPCRERGGR